MARYVKRGKVWQYEISYKDNYGTFNKIRKSGFKTKGEAIAEAGDIESRLKQGFKVNTKNKSLVTAFTEWIKVFKKDKIQDSTYGTYLSTLAYLNKYLPNATVKNIDRISYQYAINEMGKELSSGTIKNFNRQIRSCIKFLVSEGVIQYDFTQGVAIKGRGKDTGNWVKYLDFDEFEKLVSTLQKEMSPINVFSIMCYIGAMTGMRYSEVAGLTWDNIDFTNNKIKVDKAWRNDKKDFGPTKNKSSVREITIDGTFKMLLYRYKNRQNKVFSELEVTNPLNLVCWHPKRGIIENAVVNKELAQICQRAGLENRITTHGLRHTHASVLIYKSVNIMTISKRLGHANISITLDTYSHIIKELEKAEDKKVIDIFSKINRKK